MCKLVLMKIPQIVENMDKALDAVLSLKSAKNGRLMSYLGLKGLPLTQEGMDAIINQLMEDKLIIINGGDITPTIKAYLGKGYVHQFKKEKYIRYRNRFEQIILSYGTGFAGAYGLFEIAKWYAHHICWHLLF